MLNETRLVIAELPGANPNQMRQLIDNCERKRIGGRPFPTVAADDKVVVSARG